MTERQEQFAVEYALALRAYLASTDERGLTAAYELGRGAVDRGAGVLDILAAHTEALHLVLDEAPAEVARAAAAFLFECIAPLEMAYRGFIDANHALSTVNEQLEQTVRQRTSELATALCDLADQTAARLRYAREVNDSIVQVLVAAEMAADLGHAEQSRSMLEAASRAARAWIGEQLRDFGPLQPGSLVRERPADPARTEEATP